MMFIKPSKVRDFFKNDFESPESLLSPCKRSGCVAGCKSLCSEDTRMNVPSTFCHRPVSCFKLLQWFFLIFLLASLTILKSSNCCLASGYNKRSFHAFGIQCIVL